MFKDKQKDSVQDMIFSFGLIVFSVIVALFIIPNYVADAGFTQVSPRFFPYVGITLLGVCASSLFVMSLRQFIKLKYSAAMQSDDQSLKMVDLLSCLGGLKRPIIVMFILGIFVFLFQQFGYFMSVPFMLLSLMLILGRRQLLKSLGMAVVVSVGVFVCFQYLLGFPLV